MKLTLKLFSIVMLTCALASGAVTKIACVGDSITYGAGIKDHKTQTYPAQLQAILGDSYDVRNFGVSGTTLLKHGDMPYWNYKAFKEAKSFDPSVVVIMLGTNDSKPKNWSHKKDFKHDLTEMVREFQQLPSHPTVYLCDPVPAYPGRWGISNQVIHDQVIPLVNEVAKEQHCPTINLYRALSNKKDLFPDTVHPNPKGAKLMAEAVAKAIRGNSSRATIQSGTR